MLAKEKIKAILNGMEPEIFSSGTVDLPTLKKLRQKYGKDLIGFINSTKKVEKAVINLDTMEREVIADGKPTGLVATANFVVAICELEIAVSNISDKLDIACPECGHKLSRKTAYYAGATVAYTCVNAVCEKTAKAVPTPVVLRHKALDYCDCYSYEERQKIKNSMEQLPFKEKQANTSGKILYEGLGAE